MPKEDLEELLDTRSVSRHLGISRQTLDKARARGEISYYRIGAGRIRYSRQQVLDYLVKSEQARSTSSAPAKLHQQNQASV
jgi:excisionase family DNA binding protein